MVNIAVWHTEVKTWICWTHLMLGTWFFSCCLKKKMNNKCSFKLWQQMLLLLGEKLPWEHIWRKNESNVFWKGILIMTVYFCTWFAFWSTLRSDIDYPSSIALRTLRSQVKRITISITRHFDHWQLWSLFRLFCVIEGFSFSS